MIRIREATGQDTQAIRDIFYACYGQDYPYQQFYDPQQLLKIVYSDDTLILVAEDTDQQQVLGTASVILEIGAFSDLVGEFGRLAVTPDARHHGVGKLLMEERLARVRDRLHIGLIEGRVAHPFTLRIAESHGFAVVGIMPLKMMLRQRESLALMVQYFGNALELRNNHPRVIPEVYPLGCLAMENCGLTPDLIVDEDSAAYPHGQGFDVQELSEQGYSALLRIERGRVKHREIFGPMRLHYGLFKLQSGKSRYLIARDQGRIAGAIGFTLDPVDRVVRVFELISLHDDVVRFLLQEMVRMCKETWEMAYVEVDVSAFAPRMQRTLLELGFLPVAYVPALVFHEVERLDVVKMVRLLAPLQFDAMHLSPKAQQIAELVLRGFVTRQVLPRIAEAAQHMALFRGLNDEQLRRLAGTCSLRTFAAGDTVFLPGTPGAEMYLLLSGRATVDLPERAEPLGTVGEGQCLGELALLRGAAHWARATATEPIEAAVLGERDFQDLIRQRPDIGLLLYKNLALDIGEKLRRAGQGPGA